MCIRDSLSPARLTASCIQLPFCQMPSYRSQNQARAPEALLPQASSVAPVSYTHLDVYKRQVVSLARSIGWPLILMAALPALFGREAIWFCHSAAEALTAACAFALLCAHRRRP